MLPKQTKNIKIEITLKTVVLDNSLSLDECLLLG